MTRCLSAVLCAALLLVLSSAAYAQTTDARDYEGAGAAPDNTFVAHNYLRHVTTSGSQIRTVNSSYFRAAYLKKFGNFAFLPFDFLLPVADAQLQLYPGVPANGQTTAAPTPKPNGPASVASIHGSGLGDLNYYPTVVYDVVENKEQRTHTYVGASLLMSMPTGTYDPKAALNIGENRWSFKPNLIVGQRFLRVLTLEAVANATLYTDNPNVAARTAKGVVSVSQHQDPTYGAEAHVGVDVHSTMYLSASYYYTSIGQKFTPLAVIDERTSVQTARFTFGIHVEKQTLLYLQLQQDLRTTGDTPNSRFFGARITHFFF